MAMLTSMKIRSTALALGIVAIALAGCTSAPPSDKAAPSVESAVSPSPSQTPEDTSDEPAKSERGNLIKNVGDVFGLGTSDESVASFVVTKITVDPQCTSEFAEAPEHGHFVRLDIEGETTADLPGELYFAGGSWTAIADNGTTFNGDPWSYTAVTCVDDVDRFPSIIGPGERVAGAVILDVPTPTGVLVLSPEPGLGWEWKY